MTVRRRGSGKWYVAKLEKYHKRQLVTPAMRHFLRSHKQECDSNAKDEADMDTMISVELQGSLPKGKNSYFDVLYQEAVKCAEKGMASDHSFKVVLAV
ncbi:hypothetical protein WN943_005620 [Citrus x changshan-huyou]